MKARTKEEMAAYQRFRRLGLKGGAPVVTPGSFVTPIVSPVVTPCQGCSDRDMANKILRAKLLAAEKQVELMKRDRQAMQEGAKPSPYKFGPEWQR